MNPEELERFRQFYRREADLRGEPRNTWELCLHAARCLLFHNCVPAPMTDEGFLSAERG